MKIRTKLLLLVVIPLCALTIQGALEFRLSYQQMQQTSMLQQTSSLASQISNLVHEIQKERGRTAGFLGSKGTQFASELAQQRSASDDKLAKLMSALNAYPKERATQGIQNRLDEAVKATEQLAQTRKQVDDQSITTAQAIGYYTQLNTQMLTVIQCMADQSTSGHVATELAANLYLQKTKENAGIERALLSSTFAADTFSPVIFQKFIGNLAQQQAYMKEFENLSTAPMLQIFKEISEHPSFARVDQYRQIALDKSASGGFGVKSSDWFDTITQKINELKKAEDRITTCIDKEIMEIHHQAQNQMYMIGSLCLGFSLLTIFIGLWSYRSINRPICAMTARMQDIARGEGDLTQRVDATRKDELGVMAGFFNQFVEKIQHTVQNVSQATHEVASAATQIAATSEQMATSLEQQKSQHAQVAASVEQLSASVMEIANRTTTLASHSSSSGNTAREGNSVVGNAVDQIQQIARIVNEASSQMQELGERSQAIGMVISVINDIADQTNLLALNAAIEAARAGQHGRGFAVVADEVRKLAERTTTATDEVAQLITAIQQQTQNAIKHMDQGTSLVVEGVNAATSAGEALTRIVDDTQEVDSLVSSIAAATEQQSSATMEISRSIDAMSSTADQSNEAAGQAASAALQLSRRSESLQTLVNQFKV